MYPTSPLNNVRSPQRKRKRQKLVRATLSSKPPTFAIPPPPLESFQPSTLVKTPLKMKNQATALTGEKNPENPNLTQEESLFTGVEVTVKKKQPEQTRSEIDKPAVFEGKTIHTTQTELKQKDPLFNPKKTGSESFRNREFEDA